MTPQLEPTPAPRDTVWWRLVHLDPVILRGGLTSVFTILGSLGILVAPGLDDSLVTAWVGVMGIVGVVWVRPAVTANARVAVWVPDPVNRPNVVASGEASPDQASDRAILRAAREDPVPAA